MVDPATAQPFATASKADLAQLRSALTAAEEALPAWRAMPARDRGILLHKVADELVRRKAEIARIITLENSKPPARSREALAMSVDHLGHRPRPKFLRPGD